MPQLDDIVLSCEIFHSDLWRSEAELVQSVENTLGIPRFGLHKDIEVARETWCTVVS